jgi:hypothetical protein
MINHAATMPIAVEDKETFLRLLDEQGGIIRKVAAGYSSGLADRHDLELQKQIAELLRWHVRAAFWFGITGCFILIPFILAFAYSSGADIWLRKPEAVGWLAVRAWFPPLSWSGSCFGHAARERRSSRKISRTIQSAAASLARKLCWTRSLNSSANPRAAAA